MTIQKVKRARGPIWYFITVLAFRAGIQARWQILWKDIPG